MNRLISDCYEFMKEATFPYAVCGGFALELFLGKTTRPHRDIDICVFEENKSKAIQYFANKGFFIYELVNGGLFKLIKDPYKEKVSFICIFAVSPECSLINMTPTDDSEDIFTMEILKPEQTKFDFVEIIFNKKEGNNFLYAQDNNITREINKAVLYNNNVPYISPELILFFKSNPDYSSRNDYQSDFELTYPHLSATQKQWLISAMEKTYPAGHNWINILKNK